MENSSAFFKNTECKYYPCHGGIEEINCLFCYCPLYHLDPCPGDNRYVMINDKRVKVCTDCTYPHRAENYREVINKLKER